MRHNTLLEIVTKPSLAALIMLSLCSPAIAQNQIYKYKDKDGNTVFSDTKPTTPTPNTVEEVELKTINSSAPVTATKPAPEAKAAEDTKIVYSDTITSPADGSTIPMGPGNFSVSARLSPPLSGGERVLLVLDGAPVGEPQRSGSWSLNNVFRGEHKLLIQRIGRGGKVIATSQPSTVYVLRPSIR